MTGTSRPLDGIRILDFSRVLAGPLSTALLADLGAEVIKVEPPTGDDYRVIGPMKNGISSLFTALNRNKKSLTLDLKHPQAAQTIAALAQQVDVVVENFRPGVMNRLGLGYESLLQENPKLIYCAISGFGQDGPLRDLPAYDQIIQGMSGVMSITGAPENAPYRVGYPMADTIGGITAAFAVAAALADRNRTSGTFIDVSMLEAVMATMGWAVSNHLIAGREPKPMGNENVTASPSGAFQTQDGLLNIAANKQEQFEAVCHVVGLPQLIADERFHERQSRLQNRAELKALLEEAMSTKTTEEWWKLFNRAGVPAGPVYSVPQALDHPQVATRGMVGTFENAPGVGRDIRLVRTGFKVNGETPRVYTPPPALGQHADEILADLGYSAEEIDALREEKAV